MGGGGEYLENGKSWGVGGSFVKFPPWWGYGYFLEPHIRKKTSHIALYFTLFFMLSMMQKSRS